MALHQVSVSPPSWQNLQLLYQWVLQNGDKRTDGWLLVCSPLPVSFIFLRYLFIVCLGPKLMAHRRPVNIKALLMIYNFSMVCLSAYMCYGPIKRTDMENITFLIGLINSFVHVVMYMYYGLAALGPLMKKYLSWKRYLTCLQLLQFFIVTIHYAVNLIADCDFPDAMNAVVLAYAFSLIALFSNFYYQSYLAKKTKRT